VEKILREKLQWNELEDNYLLIFGFIADQPQIICAVVLDVFASLELLELAVVLDVFASLELFELAVVLDVFASLELLGFAVVLEICSPLELLELETMPGLHVIGF